MDDKNDGLAESVAATLAKRIARGQYAPGDKLPTVRELATELDVSVVTVRISMALLEAALLVETVPRVGTRVRDPQRDAGVRAWALLADRENVDVPFMRAYLSDSVKLLHAVMADVLRDLPKVSDMAPINKAVERLQKVVAATPRDHHRAMEAQMAAFRSVLIATNHPMYLGLVNEINALTAKWDGLAAFIVPDPEATALRWRVLMGMLPQLDERTIESIAMPMLRTGGDEAMRWFDKWAATDAGKR